MLPNVFLFALAIRWLYALVLFAAMGKDGLMGPDSYGYVINAQAFAQAAASNALHDWQWLGRELSVMPLFNWLLSVHVALFGEAAPLTYVLMQGLIDAGTCLVIYGLAATLHTRYALPAAVAASLNPTQIVLAGLVYTDTLFVFFVALSLLGAGRWLRTPSLGNAALVGVGVGLAAICRIMIVPWTLVVLIALLGLAFISGRFQARQIGQTVLAGAIVAVCVAPILARNVTQYGAWALTPQTGGHSAFWVVPLVQEASDGTPWSQGSQEMKRRIRERFGEPLANPFDEARRHIQVAREALAELGPAAVAKAWAFGAAINLASPAIIISPPIARLPRTGFFATAANSIVEKVLNFLFRSDNALYAWMLLLGIAGVAIIRLVQLSGLVVILRNGGSFPVLTILVLWSLYVLAINGPVASPKYRLPMEPALMVLTGAGLSVFRRRPVTPMRRDG